MLLRLSIVLLALACALPASGDEGNVRTSRDGARVLPLPRGDDVFHFVIYGDRTGGPAAGIQVLAQAVSDTNLLDPDLVMTVGDLVQGYNTTEPWLAQMQEFRGVMSGLDMPWYPVAGNHDVYWRGSPPPEGHHESRYETHFGPLWYWFPHKNAAFVVLYTDEGDTETNRKGWNRPDVNQMSATQLAWLESTLVETRGYDHVFVFMHHPRWRSDYYRGTNWEAAHERLKAAGNVSAVFAGHMHRQRYEGKRDGIEYYTLAATGGGMPFSARGTGFLHHLDVVTVRKGAFSIATIPVGQMIDPREMTPEHIAEIDGLLRIAPAPVTHPFLIECDGSCAGQITLQVENPVAHPIEVTLAVHESDDAWVIRPDHVHQAIAVGARGHFTFRYHRRAEPLETMRAPRITLRATWIGKTLRVDVPERVTTAGVRLTSLPEGFFEAPDAAGVFDGARHAVRVSADQIELPQGPFTVEAWMRGDSFEGRRALVSKAEQSEYGLFVSDGAPSFAVMAGSSYATAEGAKGTLEHDRWYHVAGVFDGAAVSLYVDGRLVASEQAAAPRRVNALPLYVGADPNGRGDPISFFDGSIDEVRISTGARYAAAFEPARRHEPDAETVLLLHMDRGVGAFVPDAGPEARHAVAPNGMTYAPR